MILIQEFPLPYKWMFPGIDAGEGLPQADWLWVSQALFIQKKGPKQYKETNEFWHYPPAMPETPDIHPDWKHYDRHPFFMWRPYNILRYAFSCIKCDTDSNLVAAGTHAKVRGSAPFKHGIKI